MNTTEQIKKAIVSYLTKTSAHTFIRPKAIYKWQSTGGYYEYDYNNFTYFKIIKQGDDFFYLDQKVYDKFIRRIDIDYYIKYWGKNSKCVLSNQLFSDKKMKSIKNTKFVESEIDEILKTKS